MPKSIVKMNKSAPHGNVVMLIQAHVRNMIWLKRVILFTMHIINRWSSPDQIMVPVILVDLQKLFLIALHYQVQVTHSSPNPKLGWLGKLGKLEKGSSARFVCSEILTICGSGINDIFVNQACSSAESLSCCISDYNSCDDDTLIDESSAIYTAWANALNHPAGVCDFSGTARYAHEQVTPCA